MTPEQTAIETAPDPTHGIPIGYVKTGSLTTDDDDARLAVEILLPEYNNSLWNVAEWEPATPSYGIWNTVAWVDITQYVRGVEWFQGADELKGRPRAGVAEITLENEGGLFSLLDPTSTLNDSVRAIDDDTLSNYYFNPGTLVRVVAHNYNLSDSFPAANPSWQPLFTGVVEQWTQRIEHGGVEDYVTLTVVDTISQLARVDENALGSAEGLDDTVAQRIERLADAAGWPYGYNHLYGAENFATALGVHGTYGPSDIRLQSTDMALNRLQELYLTADSAGVNIRSGRDGKLLTLDRYYDYDHPYWGSAFSVHVKVPDGYDTSSTNTAQVSNELVTVKSDDEAIYTEVNLSRAGGSQQSAEDTVLKTRYGRINYTRNDLINRSDAMTAELAQAILFFHSSPLIISSVTLDSNEDTENTLRHLIELEIGQSVRFYFYTPDGNNRTTLTAEVESVEHKISVQDTNKVHWTCKVSFGFISSLTAYEATP